MYPSREVIQMEKLRVRGGITSAGRRSVSMEEPGAYHRQLLDKINHQNLSVSISNNPDTPQLMRFNGYYTLANAAGAFFAIDTDMLVLIRPLTEPIDLSLIAYDLSLIISLDGQSADRYPFSGTFDGTTLTQDGGGSGPSINLTITRTVGSSGAVASCSGTFTFPGQPAVTVSGTTYNNPIPAALFAGDYYVTGSGSASPPEAMRIGSDNHVYYDGGSNSGQLSLVGDYAYNMNMYYFTFMQDGATVNLIMGTASEQGFACNNMTIGPGSALTVRSLLTIPSAQKPDPELSDPGISQLAGLSGYYPIQEAASPFAFMSIQAQYATADPNTGADLYSVLISVSSDGVTSQAYYFDPSTMTFDGATLTMPQQNITVTLSRGYDPQNGSLVSLTGTINGEPVSGSTPFNPVPLSAFGGVTMTNSNGDQLTVNGDNSVTYNGITTNSIIYVPLMYIVAYPVDDPSVVMSFGTAGTHGLACIVTEDANTAAPKTKTVSAIPS